MEAKEWAAHALGNMACGSEQRSAQIFQAGALPRLISLMTKGATQVQRAVLETTLRLAAHRANESGCKQVIHGGALQPMVFLLKEGAAEVVPAAIAVLGILVTSSKERSMQVINAGALQPLVALLKRDSDETCMSAALVLGRMGECAATLRAQIVDAGALSALATMFKGRSRDAAQLAMATMMTLSGKSMEYWRGHMDEVCVVGGFRTSGCPNDFRNG